MNVLIVDDHPLVCSGIRNILVSEPEISSIMQANDIRTAMGLMEKNGVDLALVDMRLKDESGVDFIQAAKAGHPDCKFVILSSSSTAGDFDRAMHVNVDGYILRMHFRKISSML